MRKEYILPFLSYLIVILFIAYDIKEDISEGTSLSHILIEAFLIIITSTAALYLILILLKNKRELVSSLDNTTRKLDNARLDINTWKKQSAIFTQGLAQEIDRQFQEWKLSASEKEIAILIIKGISTKEIAGIRQTSEKTIRAQLSSIYKKASVSGRSELSSFFLEDLLLPS